VLKLLFQAPKVDTNVQNKAQVRTGEGWIVVSVNHKHVDLSMSLNTTLALEPNKLFVPEFVMGACSSATCVSW
jgi:hypothetical protein